VPAKKQRVGSASPKRSSSIGCRSFSRVASQLPTGENKGGSGASEIILNPCANLLIEKGLNFRNFSECSLKLQENLLALQTAP
jgi:hypothetical protein